MSVPQLNSPMPESSQQVQVYSAGGVESNRAAMEVQAMVMMAKKFPRNEVQAFNKVMEACKRRSLAETAIYSYPRGGTTVTGPSIRIAETIARYWGNIQFGIVELEQSDGVSDVMAYAWDVESNTREVKVFKVPHERHTKSGVTKLKDPRDIYELVANQGARRLRSCILGVLPDDIIQDAVEVCKRTRALGADASGANLPLIERVRKRVPMFAEFGVTQEMVEKKLGVTLDKATPAHLDTMNEWVVALRGADITPDELFAEKPAVAGPTPTPQPTQPPAPTLTKDGSLVAGTVGEPRTVQPTVTAPAAVAAAAPAPQAPKPTQPAAPTPVTTSDFGGD